MQDKELFKEFVSFCESRPADKKINHSSWRDCAVGEFADYLGVSVKSTSDCRTFITKLLGEYTDDKGTLCGRISCAVCPDTYGEFTAFLKEYL